MDVLIKVTSQIRPWTVHLPPTPQNAPPSLIFLLTSLSPPLLRHRSINLFLSGYQRLWIETEEYSFEEKLVQDLAVSTGLASALPRVLCVPAGAFSAAECSAASTVPAQAREHVSARLMYSSWPVFSSAGYVTHYRPRHSSQGMHDFRLSLSPRHLTRKAVRFSAAVVRGADVPRDAPLCSLGVVFLS